MPHSPSTYPRDVGVADVRLIQVLAKVPQTSGCQEEAVKLEQEPLLLLGFVGVVPDVALEGTMASAE